MKTRKKPLWKRLAAIVVLPFRAVVWLIIAILRLQDWVYRGWR